MGFQQDFVRRMGVRRKSIFNAISIVETRLFFSIWGRRMLR